jgi:hypothetical protein
VRCFIEVRHKLREVDHTCLALIPKSKETSIYGKSFQSSDQEVLCNLIYKVISKSLANRLKPLLNKLITLWHAGFIPGRLIQDNSILAHELFNKKERRKARPE